MFDLNIADGYMARKKKQKNKSNYSKPISINIRERKEKLSYSDSFPDLNPNPVLETDLSGNITYLNPATEKEFPELRELKLTHPLLKNLQPVISIFQEKNQTSYSFEIELGKETYIVSSIYIDKFNRIRFYFRNITPRKLAEKALITEKETLEVIMENTEAHLAYLDSQFNFITVNTTYAKGSGHTKKELIGQNHFKLFPNKENKKIFKKARDTGRTIEYKAKPFEYANQPWRGVTYWDWTLTPVKNNKGKVEGLVLSLVDVTKSFRLKQLSDALNQINETIHSTLNFDEILSMVLKKAIEALNVTSVSIIMPDTGQWVVKARLPEELIGMRLMHDQFPHFISLIESYEIGIFRADSKEIIIEPEIISKFGIKSLLSIPLIYRGELKGIILFGDNRGPADFTGPQIDFAKRLSITLTLAMENARLFEAEKNARQRSELLSNIIKNMSDGFALVDKKWHFRFLNDKAVESLAKGPREEIIGKTLWELFPDILGTEFEEYFRKAMTEREPVTFETLYSGLNIWFEIRVHPAPDGIALFYSDISERKEAEKLTLARYRILDAANKTESLDLFIRSIINEVEYLTDSKIGFYHFLEDDQETLTLQEWSTNTIENMCSAEAKGAHYPISKAGVWIDAVYEKKPVIHNDYRSLKHKKGLPKGHAPVIREMVIPITRGNKIVAIFGVGNKAADYTKTDVKVALFLGDFSWEIVERKRAQENLRTQLYRTQLLEEIAVAATTSPNLKTICEKVLQTIVSKMQLKIGTIYTFDETNRVLNLLAFHGISNEYANRISKVPLKENKHLLISQAVINRKIMTGKDMEATKERLEMLKDAGLKNTRNIAIPVDYKGKILGTLSFDFEERKDFTSREKDLFHSINHTIGQAIENTRLYESEHRIAETLQKSLMSFEIPKIEGLQIEYFYQSASEGADVGGDFFDIFEIPGDGYGIVVGDVSGKGIEAAAETAKVRYLLRDKAYKGLPPSNVLASVNKSLYIQKTTSLAAFTALTYCLYEPKSSKIILSNAANPYPYLVSEDRFIELTNIPVSIEINEKYRSVDIKLEKDDILLIFTDGLTEARYKKELFGEESIRKFIKKNVGAGLKPTPTLNNLIKGLVDEARNFSHDNLTDDILVIGIRKT